MGYAPRVSELLLTGVYLTHAVPVFHLSGYPAAALLAIYSPACPLFHDGSTGSFKNPDFCPSRLTMM